MLAEGCTFTEIAEHFGVSRQCVQQYYTRGSKSLPRNKHMIIYPAIRKWMKQHRESYYSLGRELFPDVNVPGNTIRLILIGKTRNVPIDTIKKLVAYTGIPFEVITADAEEMKDGDPAALVMENARQIGRAHV